MKILERMYGKTDSMRRGNELSKWTSFNFQKNKRNLGTSD